MPFPEILQSPQEVLGIPKELMGEARSITSGDGRKKLIFRCYQAWSSEGKMTPLRILSLSLKGKWQTNIWGGAWIDIMNARIKRRDDGGQELVIDFDAIADSPDNKTTVTAKYSTKHNGAIERRGFSTSYLQDTSETRDKFRKFDMIPWTGLPQEIDVEQTIREFLELAYELWAADERGETLEDFPTPQLIPA